MPPPVHLRRKHRVKPLPRPRGDRTVVEHASSVHHRPQRALARDRLDQFPSLLAIGHIARADRDVHTKLAKRLLKLLCTRRRGALSAHEHEATNPVTLSHMPRHETPQNTCATRDEHSPLSAWTRRSLREHDLSDMPRLRHETERLRCTTHIPRSERKMLQHPPLEQLEQLDEHALHTLGSGFDQIERAIGSLRPALPDLRRIANIGLAPLEKPSTLAEQ